MKSIIGLFVFFLVFALVGVATHFAIYNKPGIFIWSQNESGGFSQTTLKAEGPTLVKPAGEEKQKIENPVEKAEPEEKAPPAPEVAADPEPQAEVDPNVIPLFNGKDLGNWEITQYGGEGEVIVNEEGELEFGFGAILTGVHWSVDPPQTSNYEISLEAMKLDGTDFFCALTFPVKDSHASFVIGGWGGGIVGISSVDDLDASENETMNIEGFNEGVWYKVKVRVTDEKIQAWIDDSEMVDLDLKDRKISLRPGDIELSVPIGLASFQTRAKYRNLVWTNLSDANGAE